MFYVNHEFEIEKFRAAPQSQWPQWFRFSRSWNTGQWHWNAGSGRAVPASRCFKTQQAAIDFIVNTTESERASRRMAIEQLTKKLKRLKMRSRIIETRHLLKENHDRLRELKQIKERLTCGAS
jgi:hypothetical protein